MGNATVIYLISLIASWSLMAMDNRGSQSGTPPTADEMARPTNVEEYNEKVCERSQSIWVGGQSISCQSASQEQLNEKASEACERAGGKLAVFQESMARPEAQRSGREIVTPNSSSGGLSANASVRVKTGPKCVCDDTNEEAVLREGPHFHCEPKDEDSNSDSNDKKDDKAGEQAQQMMQQMAQCMAQAAQQGDQVSQQKSQCEGNFQTARISCDPDSAVGVKGAIDEARYREKLVAEASQSAKVERCEKLQEATKKLAQTLVEFRNRCGPAKAQCISQCKNAQNAVTQAKDNQKKSMMACIPMIGGILAAMNSASSYSSDAATRCDGYDSVMDTADNQVESVLQDVRNSSECEFDKTDCTFNPDQEKCRREDLNARLNTEGISQVSDALAVNDPGSSSATNPFNQTSAAASIEPVQAQPGNANRANPITPGAAANLGNSSGGAGAPPRRGGGGFYGNHGDTYERLKNIRPRGKKGGPPQASSARSAAFKGSRFRRGSLGSRRPSSQVGGKGGLPLQRFLPPSKSGVSSAGGLSNFEKVSNRYKLYKPKLLQR